LPLPVTF